MWTSTQDALYLYSLFALHFLAFTCPVHGIEYAKVVLNNHYKITIRWLTPFSPTIFFFLMSGLLFLTHQFRLRGHTEEIVNPGYLIRSSMVQMVDFVNCSDLLSNSNGYCSTLRGIKLNISLDYNELNKSSSSYSYDYSLE